MALGVVGVVLLALVFAAGVFVGGSRQSTEHGSQAPSPATGRAMYSPNVLGDPYFLDRQRANVAALERACSDRGELCAEARDARRWLDEQEAER